MLTGCTILLILCHLQVMLRKSQYQSNEASTKNFYINSSSPTSYHVFLVIIMPVSLSAELSTRCLRRKRLENNTVEMTEEQPRPQQIYTDKFVGLNDEKFSGRKEKQKGQTLTQWYTVHGSKPLRETSSTSSHFVLLPGFDLWKISNSLLKSHHPYFVTLWNDNPDSRRSPNLTGHKTILIERCGPS